MSKFQKEIYGSKSQKKIKWYDLAFEERCEAASQVHVVIFAQLGALAHSMVEFGCSLKTACAFVRRLSIRHQLPLSHRSMLLQHLIDRNNTIHNHSPSTPTKNDTSILQTPTQPSILPTTPMESNQNITHDESTNNMDTNMENSPSKHDNDTSLLQTPTQPSILPTTPMESNRNITHDECKNNMDTNMENSPSKHDDSNNIIPTSGETNQDANTEPEPKSPPKYHHVKSDKMLRSNELLDLVIPVLAHEEQRDDDKPLEEPDSKVVGVNEKTDTVIVLSAA